MMTARGCTLSPGGHPWARRLSRKLTRLDSEGLQTEKAKVVKYLAERFSVQCDGYQGTACNCFQTDVPCVHSVSGMLQEQERELLARQCLRKQGKSNCLKSYPLNNIYYLGVFSSSLVGWLGYKFKQDSPPNLRRKWQATPVFLPGEFHEQRSLVGYSPWGHNESDMTEPLTHTYSSTKKKMQLVFLNESK